MNVSEKDLKTVDNAKTLQEAQIAATAILGKMNHKATPMKPEKVSYLTRNIQNARSKVDVMMIVYNMFLSGEGLSSTGSHYQKRFK